MILGRTYKERDRRREIKESKWYAWYPIHLADGRWCWFEYVKYRLVYNLEDSCFIYHLLDK